MKKGIEVDLLKGDVVQQCKKSRALVAVFNVSTVRGDHRNPSFVDTIKNEVHKIYESDLVPMVMVDDLNLLDARNLSSLRVSCGIAVQCGVKGIIIKGDHKNIIDTDIPSHRSLVANIGRVIRDVPIPIYIGATGCVDPAMLRKEVDSFSASSSGRVKTMCDRVTQESVLTCDMLEIPVTLDIRKKSLLEGIKSSLCGFSGYIIFTGKHKDFAEKSIKLESLLV